MAIVSMLGFDQYPTGATLPATIINPMFNGADGNAPKYSLFTLGSGFSGYNVANYLAYAEATDTCNYIVPNMTFSTVASSNNNYVLRPPTDITATDLDKTGNWYFGAMVRTPSLSAGAAASALAVLGDGTIANNVYFATFGSTPNTGLVNNNAIVYIEIQIDWANKMLYGYVNGILRAQKSFTTTPVVGIGNLLNTPYGSTTTYWCSGLTTSYWLSFSNIYWVIDKLNDPAPTGRLGPCRVRVAKVNGVDVVGGMSTTDSGGSFVTPLLANAIALPITTGYVGNDAYGLEGTVHFETPTLASNAGNILAAQINTTIFKPLEASATAEIALVNGTTELSRSTYVVTNTPTLISKVVSTAKDGTALVPASMSDLSIKTSSHRN